MSGPLLSAVVTTFNNADTLPACLESLHGVDEIIVLDSHSSDETVAIATAAGALVSQQPFKGYGPQKADAIALAAHDWIILLDADEWLVDGAVETLRVAITTGDAAGFRLPRAEWLFYRYQRRTSRLNTFLRLFDRRQYQMSASTVHAAPEVSGPTPTLAHALIYHDGERDLHQRVAKINAYSTGLLIDKKRASLPALRMLLNPPWIFFKSYVLRRQFLNGWAGLIHSIVLAFYAFLKYAKVFLARA